MLQKSVAEELREWANRLERLNEYDTHSETGEPDHNINTQELMRLKTALKPLVDEEHQSRFMQILNKMNNGQPITNNESRILTQAFIAMADIIAEDPGLISRVKKDLSDFNDTHQEKPEAELEEPIISPEDLEEPEIEPTKDKHELK